MLLTNSEYQSFKIQFHCAALPDEEYCVPIYVKTPDGRTTWTVYVSGSKFHPGVDWITCFRSEALAQSVIATQSAPLPVLKDAGKDASATDFVLPMD
jgi:hypothetical protein